MEHINNLLDAPLSEVESEIIKNIEAMMGYPHQLKLAVSLCVLAEQSGEALKKIDTTNFYDDIKRRIDNVEKECDDFIIQYSEHLKQNERISEQLDITANELQGVKQHIENALGEYDRMLKDLIEKRDRLPIEKT